MEMEEDLCVIDFDDEVDDKCNGYEPIGYCKICLTPTGDPSIDCCEDSDDCKIQLREIHDSMWDMSLRMRTMNTQL